ncbi:MAG: hypothetical protein QF918_07100 [Pirellulaceae bacterium]|jgi:hypothetical protein|nr:hypothetical protein [Pirellulaceae bacterium]MDP6722974.1 hypothetical protein [Pirellulaceae bacterium]
MSLQSTIRDEGKCLSVRFGLLPLSDSRIRSSEVSLMPDGLEKSIPFQEMADLISFIKNCRYLDGKTPLGIRDD